VNLSGVINSQKNKDRYVQLQQQSNAKQQFYGNQASQAESMQSQMGMHPSPALSPNNQAHQYLYTQPQQSRKMKTLTVQQHNNFIKKSNHP